MEGDQVIKVISKVLKKVYAGNQSYIGRYGGDEFILLSDDKITVSVGYNHEVPRDPCGAWKFVVKADRRLYQEKANRPVREIS